MRLRLWHIAGALFLLSACSKTSSLSRETVDMQDSLVDSPQSKSDRPTEAGEGLPGYLIDPSKLAVESSAGNWTVTGLPMAVRNDKNEAVSARILLVKVAKSNASLQRLNQTWTIQGSQVAGTQADAQGAFVIQGSAGPDDLLFVKIEDQRGATVSYKEGVVQGSVLWIEGNAAKPIDAAASAQITSEVEAAQTSAEKARLIEQLKTTGQCRNCNLSGADLSGLEIVNCDLSFANLVGAKFVLSNVSGCNFSNSNLSQADFTQANMSGANLSQTDITGAIFSGANTGEVVGQQIPPN